MRYFILICIILFSFCCSVWTTRKERDINSIVNNSVPKWTCQPSNCSNATIGVFLRDPEVLFEGARSLKNINTNLSRTGFVELLLPIFDKTKLLCFPKSTEEYRQAQILSHVICRQLGFTVASSMNSILLPSSVYYKNYYGLKPNSFGCIGQEEKVSQCVWKSSPIERCRAATELSCYVDVSLRDQTAFFDEARSSERVNTGFTHTKFVEVSLPTHLKTKLLCFPKTTDEYEQAYALSHIFCRQMGFMTAISIKSINLLSLDDYKDYYGVKPNSYICTGQEQNISHCDWKGTIIERCSVVTELSCGDCQYSIKDPSGLVDVPGYRIVNLYNVTCEWEFVIPEDHSITLSLSPFQSIFKKSSREFCSLQESYMEIMFGKLTKMHFQRYCNPQDMQNVTISQDIVKVRIFTGFYQPEGSKTDSFKIGVGISFYTEPLEKSTSWPRIETFVALFLLISIVISGLVYFWKRNTANADRKSHKPMLQK